MTGSLDLSSVEVDGIRSIVGSSGNDTITGTTTMLSSSLNNMIDAKEGNDILAGGIGNDSLRGGSGNDRFIFLSNGGSDRIEDFLNGVDVIDLVANSANSMADITVSLATNGLDTRILAGGTTITLAGVLPSTIDASDFLF